MSTYACTVGDSGALYRVEAVDAAHAAEEAAERDCAEACEWPDEGDALRVYVRAPDGEVTAHDVYAERSIDYTAHEADGDVPADVARLLGGAL